MKKLVVAFLLASSPAFGQQAQEPQTVDPEAAVYKQLLEEANARLAAYAKQFKIFADDSAKRIAELEKRVKELEAKTAPEKKRD